MIVTLCIWLLGQTGGPDDRTELYKWFDTLGYEAVQKGDFGFAAEQYLEPKDWYSSGFLVSGAGIKFTFLSTGLYELSHPDTRRPYYKVEWHSVNLETWARKQVEIARKGTQNEGGPDYRHPLMRMEAFVVARALDARGHHALADEIVSSSEDAWKPYRHLRDVPYDIDIHDSVCDSMISDVSLAAERNDVSRTKLAERLEAVGRKIPESPRAKDALEAATVYRKMVAEDAVHARSPVTDVAKLPLRQRVAELLYRLRDVHIESVMVGRPPRFLLEFMALDKGAHNVPKALLALGFDSAPFLVESLTDKRFTRTGWMIHNPGFPVYRTRDVALEVLQELSHRSFDPSKEWRPDQTPAEADAEFVVKQKLAREWLAEIAQKGEMQVLVEAVRKGGDQVGAQAYRLAKAYPADAVPAIREGLTHPGYFGRRVLMEALRTVDSDAATALAKEHMLGDDDAGSKVEAARTVAVRDPATAATAMIKEWRTAIKKTGAYTAASDFGSYLLGCERAEGVRAVADGLAAATSTAMDEIIKDWTQGPICFLDDDRVKLLREKKAGKEYLDEFEKLLVSFIVDAETKAMNYGGPRSKPNSWSLRDFGEYNLSTGWPLKYIDRNTDTFSNKDRRSLAVKFANIWRQEHGQPPLPLPDKP